MHVFVYGTLTEPDRVAEVVDSYVFVGPARLEGLHPVDGTYPTLAPGGETPGRLLRTDELAAVDEYEGVADGLYVRVHVPLVGDEGAGADADEAAVYVGDPDRLDAAATWPGGGGFERTVREYVADEAVRVRAEPNG